MSRSNLTREEARLRAALVSDVRYEVSLDLTAGEQTFGCETVLRFRCADPGAGTFLDFVARSVTALELNGAPIPLDAFDGVRIHLSGLAPENELRVVATCAYERTGVGMHRFRDPVDGQVYVYTDSEPFDIHRVYPCFDQPDLKAAFTLSVLAPSGWEVISNSAATTHPDGPGDGPARWRFAATLPMSTYLTALAAGPFHAVRDRHRDIDLGVYCRRSLRRHLDAGEILEVTKQGFDFFERAFGYPYPFGKYDQIFVPEFNSGAMENTGCVTFNEDYIFRSRVTEAAREWRAWTILHEMAHMWFGNLVTMRWWDDLWLNESFASFVSMLALVRATRFTGAWTTFTDREKTWAYRQDQLATTHPITTDIPDIESTKLNFDGITYAKGASVLRQLVAWVGEEAFLAGLRAYFRRYEFANTDLSGFLEALEETSARDLHAWSKEWLETAGVNVLRAEFEVAPGEAGEDGETFASFAVLQEAPPEHPTLRSHRLAIGLYDTTDTGLVRRRRVETDVVGRATQIPDLVGERVADLVLVNDEDLAYAKIRLGARSLATLTERLRDLRDPLARALCWTAAWDMVRDAELPAREYVGLVLANIGGETEIGVVQSLQAQAASAIHVFGDPANRDAGLERLASAAFEALGRAEPGSDHQLAWARCLIGAARTEEHLRVLRGSLDGTTGFEGLAVDTDLRWLIVRSLSSVGAADEDLISAELARDPTDKGAREVAAARAARPTAEAKAEAWAAVVEDLTQPLATMRAIIAGFQQPDQRALLEPYAVPYFEALGQVWESCDLEVALAFASGLYPRVLIGEEVAAMTDAYLASRSPAPPIRRVLLEGRDEVARAMRARAKDAAAEVRR